MTRRLRDVWLSSVWQKMIKPPESSPPLPESISESEDSYLKIREENIQRNMKFLEDIGLGGSKNRTLSSYHGEEKVKKNTKKRILESNHEPVRRSLRILTVPAPNYKVIVNVFRKFSLC